MTAAERLRETLLSMLAEAQAMGGSDWFLGSEASRLLGTPMSGDAGREALRRALNIATSMVEGLAPTQRWRELNVEVAVLWQEADSEWRLGG